MDSISQLSSEEEVIKMAKTKRQRMLSLRKSFLSGSITKKQYNAMKVKIISPRMFSKMIRNEK
jgi:hypothetical protein